MVLTESPWRLASKTSLMVEAEGIAKMLVCPEVFGSIPVWATSFIPRTCSLLEIYQFWGV